MKFQLRAVLFGGLLAMAMHGNASAARSVPQEEQGDQKCAELQKQTDAAYEAYNTACDSGSESECDSATAALEALNKQLDQCYAGGQ